ncbi:MAG TPA: ligand-binding protein SH3 [Candidatus Omnitrophica bacterium]|nr:ligand-binding protein SH3 [Candidatus Omnitrophota bacterium]
MIEPILNLINGLPKEMTVFIISMLPVSELRGAIPIGVSIGVDLKVILPIAIIGNMVPVVPLLFFLEPVSRYLRKFPLFQGFFNWLFERAKRKASLVEKYEAIGLMCFVAIPLPITGAWTGCVCATLFKIRFRYAVLAIAGGVLIAACIVTLVTLLGKGLIYNVIIPHY